MGRTGSTWASSGDLSTMQSALPAYWQSAPGANYQSNNANLTHFCRSKIISFRTEPDWPNLPHRGSGRATPRAKWVKSATPERTRGEVLEGGWCAQTNAGGELRSWSHLPNNGSGRAATRATWTSPKEPEGKGKSFKWGGVRAKRRRGASRGGEVHQGVEGGSQGWPNLPRNGSDRDQSLVILASPGASGSSRKRCSRGWRTRSSAPTTASLGTTTRALPAYRQCASGANNQSCNPRLTSVPRSSLTSFRKESVWEDQGYGSGEDDQQEGGQGGGDKLEADLINTMSSALPAYRQSAPGANDQSSFSNLTPVPRNKLTSPRMDEGVTRGRRKGRRRPRGKRKSKQSSVSLKLLHINPRGWTSKRAAIMDMMEIEKPDYVNVNETQLRGENKVQMKGYISFSKNRKETAGGGICSAVNNRLKDHAVRVLEGGDDDEWQAVRLNHVKPAITIVNVYGEQEGRTSNEEVRANGVAS